MFLTLAINNRNILILDLFIINITLEKLKMSDKDKRIKNIRHNKTLRSRRFNMRLGTNNILPPRLEFRLLLEKINNGKGPLYYASIRFPKYYAARIELPKDEYLGNYKAISEKIKNGDYEMTLNRYGLLKIRLYPYI